MQKYNNFFENIQFNILTENGFKHFDGLARTENSNKLIKITLDNNQVISCTPEHKLYVEKDKTEFAKFLLVNDTLYGKYNNHVIKNINYETDNGVAYDVIDVEDEHSYLITPHAIKSSNCLYLDEFAFVDNDVEFYTGTYPTVTSGKNTKVIITSTPNGMNMFYKIFNEGDLKINKYKAYKIQWFEHPHRDEDWENETRANIGDAKFSVEYESVSYETKITIKELGIVQIGDLYEQLY